MCGTRHDLKFYSVAGALHNTITTSEQIAQLSSVQGVLCVSLHGGKVGFVQDYELKIIFDQSTAGVISHISDGWFHSQDTEEVFKLD